MYCPNCAAENASGAEFCRGCGESISLVPMALRGGLTKSQLNICTGLLSIGIAANVLSSGGSAYSSAFGLGLGGTIMAFGVGCVAYGAMRLRGWPRSGLRLSGAPRGVPGKRTTRRLVPPPSITEQTTRHLDGSGRHED
jgi:hypothetical protein